MTDIDVRLQLASPEGTTSTLPFDPESLTQGIRVRPATFAKMCQVSKQCVSQWIKCGKITLYPDGTLDPAKAARQVIDNSHPGRLRARVFKAAVDDVGALRRYIAALERDLAAARADIAYMERRLKEDERIERNLMALILAAAAEMRAADDARFAELLDELLDQAIIASGFPGAEEAGPGALEQKKGGGALHDPEAAAAEAAAIRAEIPDE
jgi:hypothetical protein